MGLALFEQPFYKKAIHEYEQAIEDVQKQFNEGLFKRSIITENILNRSAEINKILQDGYRELEDSCKENMAQIEANYAMDDKAANEDAAIEIIRRQNFDMQMELMDDFDLARYLSKMEDLSEYQMNKIKILLKGDRVNGARSKITQELERIEKNHHISEPWEDDKEYLKNQQLLTDMFQVRADTLWIPSEEFSLGYTPRNVQTELFNLIADYE